MSQEIRVGDWVLAWGQVLDKPHHPEDVVVELFSHNEQFACHVRLDRVQSAEEVPDFAEQCTALRMTKKGALRRCAEMKGNHLLHRDAKGKTFTHRQVVGHFEED